MTGADFILAPVRPMTRRRALTLETVPATPASKVIHCIAATDMETVLILHGPSISG